MSAPLRMIGYIRVSTDEQAASGLGLADQEARIREMVKAKPEWRLMEIIRDEGQSASTLDRPGLSRALGLLAARRADGLVVAKLDRISRSTTDFGELLDWFRETERAFISLDLGVDTSTAAGEMVAGVVMAIAQWERRAISERTKAALSRARAQGRPTGRPAVADDQQLVDRIKAMRDIEGLTLRQIAARLTEEGIPTLRGAAVWRASSVQAACGYKRPPKKRRRIDLPQAVR